MAVQKNILLYLTLQNYTTKMDKFQNEKCIFYYTRAHGENIYHKNE